MPRNDSLDDEFDFRIEETESDVSIMKRVYKNEVVGACVLLSRYRLPQRF